MPLPLLFSLPAAAAALGLTGFSYGLTRTGGERRRESVGVIPSEVSAAEARSIELETARQRQDLLLRQETYQEQQRSFEFQENQVLARDRLSESDRVGRDTTAIRLREVGERAREFDLTFRANQERAAVLHDQFEVELADRARGREEEAALRRDLANQAALSSRFASFASSLLPGWQPAISPGGGLRAIPPGSLVSAADVAQGFEPLLAPSSRLSVVSIGPGVTRLSYG